MRKADHDKSKFQNRFGNLDINQQELDRMYRQHLWEQEEMERLQALTIATSGGAVSSSAPTGLLITSADFVQGSVFNSGTTTELGTNGVDGFDVTSAGSGQMDEGYIAYDLTMDLYNRIAAAYVDAGIDPNDSQGYVWTATWGDGSTITTGLIKFGFQNSTPASLYIQTIDPADTSWENTGYNGTPLVGTFLFPLLINVYTPLTDKNSWC
jgi:hypothetical protein